jgi:glutamate synthase (NADPH/NADH) large chain
VVVLGRTGRNFAAGMSGGIAFVLDEDGDFEKRCNMAMVELEPVPEETQALQNLEGGELESHGHVNINQLAQGDERQLRTLIENHLRYTGSARAQQILDNWSAYLPKFVKIMPTEYRRALEKLATTAQTAATQKVERVLHG